MDGCEVDLGDIRVRPEEALLASYDAGVPHIISYMPESLLVRVPYVQWALHQDHLPPLPEGTDRK